MKEKSDSSAARFASMSAGRPGDPRAPEFVGEGFLEFDRFPAPQRVEVFHEFRQEAHAEAVGLDAPAPRCTSDAGLMKNPYTQVRGRLLWIETRRGT